MNFKIKPKILRGKKVVKQSAFGKVNSGDEEELEPSVQEVIKQQQISIEEARKDQEAYDFDHDYEDLKAQELQKEKARQNSAKYVEGLVKAKEDRKKRNMIVQNIRAKQELQHEDKVMKEIYKDKETFTTDAYKKHQLEVEKLKIEQDLEEKKQQKKSVKQFYSKFLGDSDEEGTEKKPDKKEPKKLAEKPVSNLAGKKKQFKAGLNLTKDVKGENSTLEPAKDSMQELANQVFSSKISESEILQAKQRYSERQKLK